MTLVRSKDGIFEGDFRFKGYGRLHISLRSRKKSEAKDRHDAVRRLFREKRDAMIEQLRDGVLTVERVETMVRHHEPLVPIQPPTVSPDPSAPGLTVDDQIERYLAAVEANQNRTDKTYATRRSQLKSRFAEFVFDGIRLGDVEFDRLTTRMVEAFQASLIAEGLAPNTVTSYMRGVEAMLNWGGKQEIRIAREQRRAPRPFYSPIDPETKHTHTTTRERYLEPAEAERLLAATPAPLLFPIACGLFAGFRIGEVLHLRTAFDVDLELGTLAVRDQRPIWKPKTDRSVREVPIAKPLRPILELHLARYASERWLVPSLRDESEPFVYEAFRQHFRAIVIAAGLNPDQRDPLGVTFHTLRHTFASWLVMNGVDLYTVAKLLGDRVEEVERTYARLSPDHKRRAIDRLSDAIAIPVIEASAGGDVPQHLPALTQLVTQKEAVSSV